MDFNSSLKLLTQKGVEEFKKTILKGYASEKIRIPVALDVLELKHDLSQKVSVLSNSFLSNNYTIQLREPRIRNLFSFRVSKQPQFNYKNKTLELGLNFDKIIIQSNDLTIISKFKIGRIVKKKIYNSDLELNISNINIDLLFTFHTDFNRREFSISALGARFRCDNITVNCKYNGLINLILACLSPYIKNKISRQLGERISNLLAINISNIYKLQKDLLNKVVDVYDIKINEGGWQASQVPRCLQGFNRIGQFPLPTLWELPAVDENKLECSSLRAIMEKSQTGDLVLFSGTLPSSQRIRRLSQSPFSHVLLVVREAGLVDNKVLAWQATAGSHRALLRDMESKPGLQLNFLDEVIDDYRKDHPDAVIVYRRLVQGGQDETIEEKYRRRLIDYIRMMDGKSYTEDMDKLFLMGVLEVNNPGRDNYYCAGLVADSLMRLGVLDSIFVQHQYAPRDFSSAQKNCPFVEGFSYEDDIIIKSERI